MILTLRILRLRQPTCSRRSLRLGCSWPSEIGGSEEESCSLNRPKLGPKGKTTTTAAEEAEGRSRSQQSVANELGRNDHDDGGEVHDALIRDRQKQRGEEGEEGGEGEAEADCECRAQERLPRGLFWSVPPLKIQFTSRLPTPFPPPPPPITAPEPCCSSQDL